MGPRNPCWKPLRRNNFQMDRRKSSSKKGSVDIRVTLEFPSRRIIFETKSSVSQWKLRIISAHFHLFKWIKSRAELSTSRSTAQMSQLLIQLGLNRGWVDVDWMAYFSGAKCRLRRRNANFESFSWNFVFQLVRLPWETMIQPTIGLFIHKFIPFVNFVFPPPTFDVWHWLTNQSIDSCLLPIISPVQDSKISTCKCHW